MLLEREKAAGVEPDPEIDAFVKVGTARRRASPLWRLCVAPPVSRTLCTVFLLHAEPKLLSIAKFRHVVSLRVATPGTCSNSGSSTLHERACVFSNR